jgi:membrane protein DedA with SNARE-associated domain
MSHPATAPPAAALTEWAQEAVTSGGALVLGLLVLLENLFPPLPSEAILPLAGFLVAQGVLNPAAAFAAATAGSVAGALVLYALGRHGGRPLLERHGRLLRLDAERLDRADAWFDRHGPKLVLFGRLVPGVRSVISIPAGLSEMPIKRFVALTALGSGAWNALLIGAGWTLGSRWEEVTRTVEALDAWVCVALAAAALLALAHAVLGRRARRVQ